MALPPPAFLSLGIFLAGGMALLALFFLPDFQVEIISPFVNGWLLVSNGIHNAFLLVRERPLLLGLMGGAGQLLGLLIFTGGLILLRRMVRKDDSLWLTVALGVLFGSVSFQLWLANNQVLLGVFCWFPALLAISIFFAERVDQTSAFWLRFVLFALVTLFAGYAAGAFAPLLFMISFVFCCGNGPIGRPWTLISTFFIIGLLLLSFTPVPPWPDYPAGARILLSSAPVTIIRNLVGFDPPLPSFDRLAYRNSSFFPFAALFVALVVAFLVERRGSDRTRISVLALLVVLFALTDVLLPLSLVDMSPLAAASRIIPFAALYPIGEIILIAGVITFGVMSSLRTTLGMALVVASCVLMREPPSLMLGEQLRFPTPSLPLVSVYGDELLRRRKEALQGKEYWLDSAAAELFSSRNEERLSLAVDGVRDTRWSVPSDAHQMRDFLLLRLKAPMRLRGIILDTADFWTDFPEGIRVRGSSDCPGKTREGLVEESLQWKSLVDETPWRGPVRFTPDGHPYWEQNGRGDLIFDRTETVHCLRIEPTIQKPLYDWSVSQIGLIVEQ